MKTCSCCKNDKDESEFSKNAQNPDGLAYYCRVCNATKMREWKARHPETVKAQKRAYNKKQRLLRERARA